MHKVHIYTTDKYTTHLEVDTCKVNKKKIEWIIKLKGDVCVLKTFMKDVHMRKKKT